MRRAEYPGREYHCGFKSRQRHWAGVTEVGIRSRLKNGVLRVQVPPPVLLHMPGCMEMGYRHGSEPCVRKDLRVRIPLRALHFTGRYANWQRHAVCKTVALGLAGSSPALPTIQDLWGSLSPGVILISNKGIRDLWGNLSPPVHKRDLWGSLSTSVHKLPQRSLVHKKNKQTENLICPVRICRRWNRCSH